MTQQENLPRTDSDRIIHFLVGYKSVDYDGHGAPFEDIRLALSDRSDTSIVHTLRWLEREKKIKMEAEGVTWLYSIVNSPSPVPASSEPVGGDNA